MNELRDLLVLAIARASQWLTNFAIAVITIITVQIIGSL